MPAITREMAGGDTALVYWIHFCCWQISTPCVRRSLGFQASRSHISVNKTRPLSRAGVSGWQKTKLGSTQTLRSQTQACVSLYLSLYLLLTLFPRFIIFCFLLRCISTAAYLKTLSADCSQFTPNAPKTQAPANQRLTGKEDLWCSTIRSSYSRRGCFPLLQQLPKGCQSSMRPSILIGLLCGRGREATLYGPFVVNPVGCDVTGLPKERKQVIQLKK